MPMYDFLCGKGHAFERLVPLARFTETQFCDCGATARRQISAPHVVSDSIAPIMGADGKMHDSMASYRFSLTPNGNPRGERFHELATGESLKRAAPKPDRKKIRNDVARSIAEVKQGRRVTPVAIDGA